MKVTIKTNASNTTDEVHYDVACDGGGCNLNGKEHLELVSYLSMCRPGVKESRKI